MGTVAAVTVVRGAGLANEGEGGAGGDGDKGGGNGIWSLTNHVEVVMMFW